MVQWQGVLTHAGLDFIKMTMMLKIDYIIGYST